MCLPFEAVIHSEIFRMPPLTLDFQLHAEDVFHWSNWATSRSNATDQGNSAAQSSLLAGRGLIRIGLISVVAGALIAGATIVWPALAFGWPALSILGVGVFFLLCGAMVYRNVNRKRIAWANQSASVRAKFEVQAGVLEQLCPRRVCITSAAIADLQAGIEYRVEWSAVRAIRRVPGLTIVQISSFFAILIPTRALPGGLTAEALATEMADLAAAAKPLQVSR